MPTDTSIKLTYLSFELGSSVWGWSGDAIASSMFGVTHGVVFIIPLIFCLNCLFSGGCTNGLIAELNNATVSELATGTEPILQEVVPEDVPQLIPNMILREIATKVTRFRTYMIPCIYMEKSIKNLKGQSNFGSNSCFKVTQISSEGDSHLAFCQESIVV